MFTVLAVALACVTPCQAKTSSEIFYHNFQNPPDTARPMMRWWWFGPAVTHEELAKELEQMHSVGIGGVEIQPVYPLSLDDPASEIKNLPYLSQPFLDAVGFANTKARSLGMRVDITLGSGWPYGGPHTTLANAAGRLKVTPVPISGATVAIPQLLAGESLIAAFQVDGTPGTYHVSSAKQLEITPGSPTIPVGPRTVGTALFFIASHTKQMVKRPSLGAEGLVLDHLSSAAIDDHLQQVATLLLAAFGKNPPTSVFSDSLEVFGSDWTPSLINEFRVRRGYDLLPHLPELALGGTPSADAVRHDWGLTLSELVNENYLARIAGFARQHKIKFRSQTYGEPAVTLADEATATLPEGEGPQWRDFSFTRWASSASHLYGRNVTSAETWTWLHSPAFRATPLDMKVEADRMFLQGVNQIVGHGWPYSPPSVPEPGWSLYAAAVFNAHNPWWPVMPDVIRYLHRSSWLLRQGEPANDVAILLPEDDAQAAFSLGHVSITDEMKKRIPSDLMSTILDAGYNVDFTDAASMRRVGFHHSLLIIPPTDRMSVATLSILEGYAATGKRIISVGRAPTLAPGLQDQASSPEIKRLWNRLLELHAPTVTRVSSTADLRAALHRALEPDLNLTGDPTEIGFIHRKLPHSDIYFVANTRNTTFTGTANFRSRRRFAEELNPETGKALRLPSGPIALDLAPYESRFFLLTSETTSKAALPMKRSTRTEASQDLSTGWQIRFGAGNPQPMAHLGSWTDIASQAFFSGEATYTRSFTLKAPTTAVMLDLGKGVPTTDTRPANAPGIHALLDPPVREAATIFINGKRVGSLWHPPYRLDVSQYVHPGVNQIEIKVDNTAINRLAGVPPHDYSALNARYGKRFVPQDMENLKPLPSGLLGPIHLLTESNTR